MFVRFVMNDMNDMTVGGNQLFTYFMPDSRLICFISWYNTGINLSKRLKKTPGGGF